jgi:trehalose 6-phosphate synthase
VRFPASGLVSALEPVMRACSGVWIAHGSGSADRDTADANGRLRVPPGEETYTLRRVWLTREEERGYYFGFSNEGLWPLCHFAHARPTFRAEDWVQYQAVNQKFADAVCDESDSDDPIVLVQDYHFALVPQMVRRRLPRATILTFWHIPWPNAESFGICPWRNQLLQGLLGSSILGFHTRLHCNNFIDAIDRYLEARIDRQDLAVVHDGQMTAVRAYPISIEWPSRWLPMLPPVDECRRSVIEELGLPDDALIGVGVDRLDYTKGIEERFLAVETMLENNPEMRGRFTFVELGAPSRAEIPRYQELDREIEELTARINERFGTPSNGSPGYRPIIVLRAQHQPLTVFRYFRAADVCYVSSLHDGMNLVAKEFVSARDDERGVLVLSDFTGAARELTEALIVNPYDIRQASNALATALRMSPEEQRERMHALRTLVSELNVYRWAGRMLLDASRQRRRERLIDRLAENHASPPML